jgi:hypothetical protein
MAEAEQFLRYCSLLVANVGGAAIDLSNLRIKFSIKKSGVMTPNVAEIRVYNLELEMAAKIKKEFTKVVLDAGYVGNHGVIFKGNIKQVISGRENSTDTFLDLVCGDGDRAYNFSVINKTIGGNGVGTMPTDQINAALSSLSSNGVGKNYVGPITAPTLPRGKTIYGNARDTLKAVADSHGFTWSIQDEQVVFVSEGTYLPGTVVVLNSKTGVIGTPQQTVEGIKLKCLLNPKLRIHGRVQLDNKSIEQYKIDFQVPGSPANTPVPLSTDGVYYIFVAEHSGDTRGLDWYTNLVTLTIDPSSNPANSVQVGYGS